MDEIEEPAWLENERYRIGGEIINIRRKQEQTGVEPRKIVTKEKTGSKFRRLLAGKGVESTAPKLAGDQGKIVDSADIQETKNRAKKTEKANRHQRKKNWLRQFFDI